MDGGACCCEVGADGDGCSDGCIDGRWTDGTAPVVLGVCTVVCEEVGDVVGTCERLVVAVVSVFLPVCVEDGTIVLLVT